LSFLMKKSPYSRDFLDRQRQLLVQERSRVMADIDADAADLRAWADGDAVEQDQHPADAATALTEQALDLSLIENGRYIVREIDDALARLDDGSYGWDDDAEVWIREERLEALPWARREVEGQRRVEAEHNRSARDSYSHDPDITTL
jgi:DnaK suppressor protein